MAMTAVANSDITADYDSSEDVLYLALGEPVASSSDEDEHGLLVRYAYEDGRACGVTVLGFRDCGWNQRVPALADSVGRYLGVDPSRVISALNGLDG
jgi:hypothetical protein